MREATYQHPLRDAALLTSTRAICSTLFRERQNVERRIYTEFEMDYDSNLWSRQQSQC